MWNITCVIGRSFKMKIYLVLVGSSNRVPGSWVLNFEKTVQNWKLEMGTSQQPEPKLGTGLQLELTPKLIS